MNDNFVLGSKEDHVAWKVHSSIEKWDPDQVKFFQRETGILVPTSDQLRSFLRPSEVTEGHGNLITTAGLNRVTAKIIGAAGQAFTNGATRIGAGNSNTAAAVGQTDLQAAAGAANRFFMTMDATYPLQSNGVMTFRATFGTGDGNFTWEEWCIDVDDDGTTASGTVVEDVMLNRRVQANGTKVNGAIWTPTMTITLS